MSQPFPPVGPSRKPTDPPIVDTWVAYPERPKVVGQYLDGRPQWDVALPFPGEPPRRQDDN